MEGEEEEEEEVAGNEIAERDERKSKRDPV